MSETRPTHPRLRLTLDSDILIDIFDAGGADPVRRPSSLRLLDLHQQQHCFLGASRELLEREWVRRSADLARSRIEALDAEEVDEAPMGARFGAMTFGRSVFVAGDVETILRRIMGVGQPTGDPAYLRKVSDIDHLLAHQMAHRDIFVTGDLQMLDPVRRKAFHVELTLTVMTAAEAVNAIERRQYLKEPES